LLAPLLLTPSRPLRFGERILGGSASYFALGASFFAPVRVVGVIGKDFPQDYLDLFAERKIDIAGIKREQGDTFHWRGRYHEDINQRDTLELHLNVLAGFVAELRAVPRRGVRFSRQHRPGHADGSLESDSQDELVVCDTMDYWIRESPEDLKKVLRRIEDAGGQ
jgi:hypothetical protein